MVYKKFMKTIRIWKFWKRIFRNFEKNLVHRNKDCWFLINTRISEKILFILKQVEQILEISRKFWKNCYRPSDELKVNKYVEMLSAFWDGLQKIYENHKKKFKNDLINFEQIKEFLRKF